MDPVLTPSAMSACDRAVIETGTTADTLVARAGAAVARSALGLLGGVYGRRVVVAAGKGNNGNDGRVAAARLRGLGVLATCHSVTDTAEVDRMRRDLERADLLVDAMYGTGFRGRLDGAAAEVAHASTGVPTLAVDIPSGVDGLTGAVDGPAVAASATVTFASRKTGLCFEPGRSLAGSIVVADIGVPPDAAGAPSAMMPTADDLAARVPPRDPRDHKWSAAVLVVGGSVGMTGAPILVGRSAAACGAGMVVVALPGDSAIAASGSEIVTRAARATEHGALASDAATPLLAESDRFGSVVVGPGLGRDLPTCEAVGHLVAEVRQPLVVDADGLHALAGNPSALGVRRAAGSPVAVLTPHDGEYEALAGRRPGPDRLGAARALASDTGAVVLLKGAGTVVADPDGDATIIGTGGPALATAGTGDVLAGVIGALLARGLEPFEAATIGAHWHGAAGDRCIEGATASDVIAELAPTLHSARLLGG